MMRVYVGKNLTRKQALSKAIKKYKQDARGFSYDKKTGFAVIL